MSTFAFLILGALAGFLARKLLPGRIGGGLFKSLILGIAGALLGGWLSSAVFHVSLGHFWDLRTWVIAVAGSLIVLLIWGLVTGKPKKSSFRSR